MKQERIYLRKQHMQLKKKIIKRASFEYYYPSMVNKWTSLQQKR